MDLGLTAQMLNHTSYVLSRIQGLNPPEIVTPTVFDLPFMYTHISQQVFLLRQAKIPVNLYTYHSMVPDKYKSLANPTNWLVLPPSHINTKTLMFISLVQAENNPQIVEVAALVMRPTAPPSYFHRVRAYHLNTDADREAQKTTHGILPGHPQASPSLNVRQDLEIFMAVHTADIIVTTQSMVRYLINPTWHDKLVVLRDHGFESKFGYASARMALDVKHKPTVNTILQRCPEEVHKDYSLFHAAQHWDLTKNEGYYKFLVGHNCAYFHVNELAMRVTAPLLIRAEKSLLPTPREMPKADDDKISSGTSFHIDSLL